MESTQQGRWQFRRWRWAVIAALGAALGWSLSTDRSTDEPRDGAVWSVVPRSESLQFHGDMVSCPFGLLRDGEAVHTWPMPIDLDGRVAIVDRSNGGERIVSTVSWSQWNNGYLAQSLSKSLYDSLTSEILVRFTFSGPDGFEKQSFELIP